MTEEFEQLREKDRVVLQHISEGRTDTHQITQATTLKDYEVRYSLNKLKELGLVTLEKPDGMVERVVNGQKRLFKAPTEAQLTEMAEMYFDECEVSTTDYSNMEHEELVDEYRDLKARIEALEESFEVFKKQVQQRMHQ